MYLPLEEDNNKNNMQQKEKGFILIYTIIMISAILVVVGTTFSSILSEVRISRDESESLKSFYAADTGIECIRYYQNNFQAFNPTTDQATYNCGIGASFVAGFNPPEAECINHTYDIVIDGFSNGACAIVEVTSVPRTIMIEGSPVVVCDLRVISNGRNSCAATGAALVERTRWEDI